MKQPYRQAPGLLGLGLFLSNGEVTLKHAPHAPQMFMTTRIIPLQWRGHVEAPSAARPSSTTIGLFLSNGEVTLKLLNLKVDEEETRIIPLQWRGHVEAESIALSAQNHEDYSSPMERSR